jgi:predicted  nucleic acid-binding Zn-ribbon protein
VSAKALKYAEETLRVHAVHNEALAARATLEETLDELKTVRDKRRDLEFRIADCEQEVASDERGRHPDMSATAMEKHLKAALYKTDSWRNLREQLSKVIGDIEGLEHDKHLADTDIKIAISRMGELGGYLSYLAEVKRAANTREAGASE